MKFFLKTILIAALAYAGELFLDWWIILAVAFLLNILIKTKGAGAFLSSFIAIFGLWAVLSFMAHQNSGGILSSKIATILPLGGNPILLIAVGALLAGVSAGFAGLAGNAIRNFFPGSKSNTKTRRNRYGRPDYMYR